MVPDNMMVKYPKSKTQFTLKYTAEHLTVNFAITAQLSALV